MDINRAYTICHVIFCIVCKENIRCITFCCLFKDLNQYFENKNNPSNLLDI